MMFLEFWAISYIEIISLMKTNSNIRNSFNNPVINARLADYYGFPYGLTYVELKKYESKSYNERLLAAAEIGDERIVKKMIEFGATTSTPVARDAIIKGNTKMFEVILKNGNPETRSTMMYAALHGRKEMVNMILSLKKDEIDLDLINRSLIDASVNANYDIIVLLVENGANAFRSAIDELSYLNSRDQDVI